MMIIRKFRKYWDSGQSTIEFTVLLMIVIGALLAGQVYFKRGVQGRWKSAVDELSVELYDPLLTDSDIVHRTASNAVVEIATVQGMDGYWTIRQDHTNSLDTRSGKKLIGGFN